MAEKCSYCGESGHSIQQCPKWKKHSSPEAKGVRMQPVGEWLRLGAKVPVSQVCDLLLQLSMIQARYALEDEKHFITPTPGLPPYTKELFARHIEDATTKVGVILEIASRLDCPNMESIKDNARIILEIRKKYLALDYRLD